MMRTWTSIPEWLERRRSLEGKRIGLVPTMGALHQGHGSLVQRCRAENDVVVVTLFVNPSQFNDPQDLERYPRTLENDLEMLEALGTDEVLAPKAEEMYPNGYGIRLEPAASSLVMEGAHRPGFLQGVMTVVLKLLNLARADRAYFGEKDFQQLVTIQEMVREFFIPTEIIGCPTVRETSGLAQSSRNMLLSSEARKKAAAIHCALQCAGNVEEARVSIEDAGLAVEYVEERWGRRLAAAYLDGVRLIDNVALEGRKR